MTPCSCQPASFPFKCQRHGCIKVEHWWRLCCERDDYFRLWEEDRGPGQSVPSGQQKPVTGSILEAIPLQPAITINCRFQGSLKRTGLSDVACRCRHGTPFEVYECLCPDLEAQYRDADGLGECSTYKMARHVNMCIGCPHSEPAERPLHPQAAWPIDGTLIAAVTVAPRSEATAHACLQSLQQAGIPTIAFCEPGSPRVSADRVIFNPHRLGCYGNWMSAARYVLEQTPAQKVLFMQDDTVVSPRSRQFLEHGWPGGPVGFVSLYTPKHYQRKYVLRRASDGLVARSYPSLSQAQRVAPAGWTAEAYDWPLGVNRIRTGNLWGACAMCFTREVLQALLAMPLVQRWRGVRFKKRTRPREPWEIANTDNMIGRALNRLRLPMYFVNPSLAQHVASRSTIGHGGLGGRRQAWRVVPDLPLHVPGEDVVEYDFMGVSA